MVNIVTTNSRPMVPVQSPTTNGSHPMLPVPSPSIAPRNPQVISGAPNPMVHIASDIKNSLYGTGSFGSNNVHIGSIQSNISRALSVSNEFSNKPAQEALLAAQKSMALASSAKDSASRATFLAQAKQSLVQANNAMASLGYGKSTPQVAPINPQPLMSASSANRRIFL
jgi:hypothetical protein